MKLQQMVPMLNVADIHRSLKFYKEIAGFELSSGQEELEQWKWAEIRSGQVVLMLAQSGYLAEKSEPVSPEEGSWPVIFYYYPEDVEQIYTHIKALGYEVGELSITFYGMKEFSLQDPDGHLLSFGQETEIPAPSVA
ncbi:MAG: hypothetical protein HC921_02120 [Synechococcaceae cyanobacterium SM2_3_1]|nr:hypothetical protein [Synechococcaceae cyanobacterium SM2_3_1]